MATNCPSTCASLAPTSSATDTTDTELVVIEYGVDYYQPQAPSEKAADLDTCVAKCQARDGCTHFSFAWGMCWFKTSSDGYVLNEYLISGNIIGGQAGAIELETARAPSLAHPVSDLLLHRLVSPREMSAQPCAELGWRLGDNSNVCGQAKPLGTCHRKSIDYRSAMATCNAAGARLCSVDELQSNAAKGAGCDLDNKNVWTSDSCGVDMFFLSKRSTASTPPQCKHISEQSSLTCCADGPASLSPEVEVDILPLAQLKELKLIKQDNKKEYKVAKREYKAIRKVYMASRDSYKQFKGELKAAANAASDVSPAEVNRVAYQSLTADSLLSSDRKQHTEPSARGGWATVGMVMAPVAIVALCALVALTIQTRRTVDLPVGAPSLDFATESSVAISLPLSEADAADIRRSLEQNYCSRQKTLTNV
jgi:hypothetical protein